MAIPMKQNQIGQLLSASKMSWLHVMNIERLIEADELPTCRTRAVLTQP